MTEPALNNGREQIEALRAASQSLDRSTFVLDRVPYK